MSEQYSWYVGNSGYEHNIEVRPGLYLTWTATARLLRCSSSVTILGPSRRPINAVSVHFHSELPVCLLMLVPKQQTIVLSELASDDAVIDDSVDLHTCWRNVCPSPDDGIFIYQTLQQSKLISKDLIKANHRTSYRPTHSYLIKSKSTWNNRQYGQSRSVFNILRYTWHCSVALIYISSLAPEQC